ncbi:flagellar hook-length control protein FliK [Sulfurimonas sp.]|uniref:flagellar hook-length control protein FliK n=1 Tax=Sulfurimonas sp. TaxID=2022749 RepID=UPI0019E7797D|nr:flagellar hook-length control protein FliK [Sulfurimonas sp.]MBE0513998.1 flagellar hook-length control protein FliK [Sulfurimonas sp.]
MINTSLNKELSIILPNTNRALATLLKGATPKEMETILKDKDLKSVMNSLLKESGVSSDSDKTLLNLAKNNPTLKDLGNITSTVKELLGTLKSEKNSLPIETTLKKFLLDIKELSEPVLKQKLENSGVFLESRLKNVQNPQVELKNILVSLEKNMLKSEMSGAKLLAQNIKELLASPTLKEATNSALLQTPKDSKSALVQLAKGVENIVSKLSEQLKSADIITTKGFEKQLSKVEHLVSQKMLSADNFKPILLQEALQQLNAQMTQSTKPEVKGLFDALIKIVESLKVVTAENMTPKAALDTLLEKKIPQEIRTVVDVLKGAAEKVDPLFSKESAALVSKLTQLTTPQTLATENNIKEILSQDLKSVLLKAGEEIAKSPHPNQTEILKHVDKLLLQIDYFQLLSHLSNSSSLYLPFSWDSLEEGNINIKKDKNSVFYCDIDLKLKEYGELKLKLALYEENQINIHIYSDNSEFKEIVKESIASLRSALIESQITPREIRIFDTPKKSSPYETAPREIDMGFEVKI